MSVTPSFSPVKEKKNAAQNLDLLTSILLWLVSAHSQLFSEVSKSDIWLPGLLHSSIWSIFSAVGSNRLTLLHDYIHYTAICLIYLTYETTGLQSNCKKKSSNRSVIDLMIVICLLLSKTSLFITCLPCCPFDALPGPPALPTIKSPNLESQDQFIYQTQTIGAYLK